MKHAMSPALDRLEPLLKRIRRLAGLKEKSRGIFYLKSKSVLHFHEDPVGLFADLRAGDDFLRYPVNSKTEQDALIKGLAKLLPP
jgi:hypothetical protein